MQTKEEHISELAEIICQALEYGHCAARSVGCIREPSKYCESVKFYLNKILAAGYTKPPIKLTLISDIEMYSLVNGFIPTDKDLKFWVDNESQYRQLNTIRQDQLAHNEQEVREQRK